MERERWIRERTYAGAEFDPERLAAARRARSARVSVCLPARNVQDTVGPIVTAIRERFVEGVPLVDEIVVIDGSSEDATATRAREAGGVVHAQATLLPERGVHGGKGEAMWKSLAVTTGDLVAWIDADIVDFDPAYVPGLLGPLLTVPEVSFVKGSYRRALGEDPDGGGRVTEICARPLLNLRVPDLAGVHQPLAGETAGRRGVLERLPFVDGYGVEIALLIDAWRAVGLGGLAQVDLGKRRHASQSTLALGPMAQLVARVILERTGDGPLPATYVRPDGCELATRALAMVERPPLAGS